MSYKCFVTFIVVVLWVIYLGSPYVVALEVEADALILVVGVHFVRWMSPRLFQTLV